jgi:ubiquinone/menaquinone biosynthesis C-methylase UbiE
MKDSIDDIARYYKTSNEDQRHAIQQLEFRVTRQILQRYLQPASSILELGAGSGRYTLDLAKAGHQITSIELVKELVEISRKHLQGSDLGNKANLLNGDARDLSIHADGSFDCALAMGPFYHLVMREDRESVLREMKRVTKPGGLVITAHLTRTGLIGYMLTRFPNWGADSPEQVTQIMQTGHLDDHPRNGEFRGYFSSLDEVTELHLNAGLRPLAVHCQDPLIASVDEVFNRMPEPLKEKWAEILFALSDEPLALGSGRSLICVSENGR